MRSVAVLRGINVGGHRKLPMAELRALAGELGLQNVVTYVQSGNLVFDGPGTGLAKRLTAAIRDRYGFEVPVIVRTGHELAAIVADCPLGRVDMAGEGSTVAVVFLADEPDPAAVPEVLAKVESPDELVVSGREVYLRCPGGFGRSKLTHTFLEKKLGVTATARNWRTVGKLVELTRG